MISKRKILRLRRISTNLMGIEKGKNVNYHSVKVKRGVIRKNRVVWWIVA